MNIVTRRTVVFTLLFFFFKILVTIAQPTVQWNKTYGGNNYETLNDALKTNDEGFLLIGSTSSSANGDVTESGKGGDFWVVRIDSTGSKDRKSVV